MPRKGRLYIQGLPQLIQLVGHNHVSVFVDEEDYRVFLQCVDKALSLYHCELHAYTLLPHELFFLLTPASKNDLSRFIQHIGRSYVHYYNQKYQRTGTLWESRYRSGLIEPTAYLLLTQQFIETYTKISKQSGISWSSYAHSVGREHQDRITPHAEYLSLGESPQQRAMQYSYFLQTPFSLTLYERMMACLQQNCVLGTQQFCQEMEAIVQRSVRPRKIGRPRKYFYNKVADWVWLEHHASKFLQRYCYNEIRLPLLEQTKLLDASYELISDEVDDSNHYKSLLRNEGTVGTLRAVSENLSLQNTSKLWYLGAMFRKLELDDYVEQYHQLGVEAFGYEDIDIELEQFMLQSDIFKALQLTSNVELRINTVGTREEFNQFRQALRDYYQPFISFFEKEHWKEWLRDTPEKLLNAQSFVFSALKEKAPSLISYLSNTSLNRFERLIIALRQLNIPFTLDPFLYPANSYCHTIFEWHSDKLAGESLVCRGGRYDDSASDLLRKPMFAYGFAFMFEPLMSLIKMTHEHLLEQRLTYLVVIPKSSLDHHFAFHIGQILRSAFPQISITNDYSYMKLSMCEQNARKLGCRFIALVSANEQELIELIDLEKGTTKEVNSNKMINTISSSLNL